MLAPSRPKSPRYRGEASLSSDPGDGYKLKYSPVHSTGTAPGTLRDEWRRAVVVVLPRGELKEEEESVETVVYRQLQQVGYIPPGPLADVLVNKSFVVFFCADLGGLPSRRLHALEAYGRYRTRGSIFVTTGEAKPASASVEILDEGSAAVQMGSSL